MKKVIFSVIMGIIAIIASVTINIIGHSDMQEYLMYLSAFAMIVAMLSALSFLEDYSKDLHL